MIDNFSGIDTEGGGGRGGGGTLWFLPLKACSDSFLKGQIKSLILHNSRYG